MDPHAQTYIENISVFSARVIDQRVGDDLMAVFEKCCFISNSLLTDPGTVIHSKSAQLVVLTTRL